MKTTAKNFVPVIAYLNPDRDAQILTWLAAQPNRSAAVREALVTYIQLPPAITSEAARFEATINPETIRQAITDALAEHLDLGMLRQMLEAVLNNALSGLAVAASAQAIQDDETESVLDDLDDNLILE